MSTTAAARSSSIRWKRRDPPVVSTATVRREGTRDNAEASALGQFEEVALELINFHCQAGNPFVHLPDAGVQVDQEGGVHAYVEWLIHDSEELGRDLGSGCIHRRARTSDVRVGHTEA